MTAIGTTAVLYFSSTVRKVSLDIHADADNTDTINISGTDPKVVGDFEELLPGQSISFTGFVGAIYVIAESGSQNLYLPFVQYEDEEIVKS